MVGFLSGCDEEFADLEEFINMVKEREPVLEPPPIPALPPLPFIYTGDGRDPFKPLEETPPLPRLSDEPPDDKGITCLKHPDGPKAQYRVRELLERIPLDAFEMVGTIKEEPKHTLVGLVKTRDGTVYKVHQGDYLGQNYGKILRISASKIEIQERFWDNKKCWISKVITLSLRAISGRKLRQNSPYFGTEN
ncbi:Pilus assembly protein PilP [Beggiatoa sp. PS]|nr:Pilus assembly protein PilP [Beggiatoa sp. PS]